MSPALHLVLTAAPGSDALTEEIVGAVAAAVPGLSGARWLAVREAWEASLAVPLADIDATAARSAAERASGARPVDINLVRADDTRRHKRLLCADMESTIIAEEMLDEMADLVGCRAEIAAITAAAMRGELDFEASLRRRVALFDGVELGKVAALGERVTLMPGAETLVRTLAANGARTALVTGGFTLFAAPVAERLGFDSVTANMLEIENGRLTGRVVPPVVSPEGKADTLVRLTRELGLAPDDTLAVGDGANDAMMLRAAGLGVAFHAKPILATQARMAANGAVVQHGDLTALLHLQGYRSADLVK